MAKIRARAASDGGGYQVRYYGPDGTRRAKTFSRKREAQAFANTVEADKVRGEWADPKLAKVAFEVYVVSYLATLSHLKPSTRLKVEGHLRNYVLPSFAHIQVADIRPAEVRAWVAALLKHGLSPATVKAIHGTFSRVMNQAILDGITARHPSFGLVLPREGPVEEMHVLEPEQIVSLADSIDPRYRALIFTAAYTGLRWSELVALRAEHLDLDKGVIYVREALVEVNGTLHPGATKTGARRTVSLPDFLVDMLAEQLQRYPSSSGHVFTSAQGQPLRRNFYQRHYLPALIASSVDAELCLCDSDSCQRRHRPLYRFHDLRHTCASLLIAQGAHPKEIQERLGHSTIRMTLDRYGHLFPSLDARLKTGLDDTYRGSLNQPQVPDNDRNDLPILFH